jgi:hypothetical protein
MAVSAYADVLASLYRLDAGENGLSNSSAWRRVEESYDPHRFAATTSLEPTAKDGRGHAARSLLLTPATGSGFARRALVSFTERIRVGTRPSPSRLWRSHGHPQRRYSPRYRPHLFRVRHGDGVSPLSPVAGSTWPSSRFIRGRLTPPTYRPRSRGIASIGLDHQEFPAPWRPLPSKGRIIKPERPVT